MRRYFIALILSIPFLLTLKIFMLLHAWYFYIPVAYIMFVNFLALMKLWLPTNEEFFLTFNIKDMKVLLQTNAILLVTFILVLLYH